jgi:quinol monooxygenase YgiN
MIILIATLTIHPDKVEAFHEYERSVAKIMAKHRGRIERAVVLDPDPEDFYYRECHIVSFPDRDALAAYRNDPDFKALAALRESCILATAIRYGSEGEDFHGGNG